MPSKFDLDTEQNTNDSASTQKGRPNRQAGIRQLNDTLRRTGEGGRVLVTASVAALPPDQQAAILAAVVAFDAFDDDNDPYAEHDSALLDVEGRLVGFRIDYYGLDLTMHSPDPADPAVTRRVVTIMMAEDA